MLTTKDNFKQWLDAANALPSSYDAEIERLLTAVSEEIEAFTFARFTPVVQTERRDGNGRDAISLIRRPVTEIIEVIVGPNTLPLASGLTDQGVVAESWGVRLRGYVFTKGRQNVSVTYRAGFATVPKLVEEACLEQAVYEWRRRPNIGISSLAMGPASTTFWQVQLTTAVKGKLATFIQAQAA